MAKGVVSLARQRKQRYYAALEREAKERELVSQPLHEELVMTDEHGDVYVELGVKAYRAFANVLDLLGGMSIGVQNGRASGGEASEVLQRLSAIERQLEEQDAALRTVTAGIRRIDKITLDTFQRRDGVGGDEDSSDSGAEATVEPKWMRKEVTIERALGAARSLKLRGERITMAAVAREAGISYARIVYAFGSREELVNQLEGVMEKTNR